MGTKKPREPWVNRIVGYGEEDPEQILANPWNWRIHPRDQKRLVSGALNDIGIVAPVLINKRTERLLDGHLRVVLALREGQKKIPVAYVDLNESEERAMLVILDKSSSMAGIDEEIYRENMEYIEGEFQSIQPFIEEELKRLGASLSGESDTERQELVRNVFGCIMVLCQDRRTLGILIKRLGVKDTKPDKALLEESFLKFGRTIEAKHVLKELGKSKTK